MTLIEKAGLEAFQRQVEESPTDTVVSSEYIFAAIRAHGLADQDEIEVEAVAEGHFARFMEARA